jgi:hypothetical protein
MSSEKKASLAEYASVEALRESNAHLLRQLDREKNRTELLQAGLNRAITDALSGLRIPPVPKPLKMKYKAGAGREEKAIVVLSDIQGGKVTPTYNSTVAEERVMRYARKVALLTGIARHDHPLNEARVYLLGDQIEGEFNFPHQPHQIDASLFRQIKDGAEVHANFLRDLLANFEKVHVVGIIGNHGRIGGRNQCVNPETNSDRMLYNLTQTILRYEKRLTWNIPWERDERAWYAVDYPFAEGRYEEVTTDHGFLLFHGDQIPGSANHSDATIARHIYGWASGAVPEPFSYAIYGHWHRPRSSRFNRFRFWANGSVESTNTYAQEKLAAVGFPEQTLLFCHAERGVTAEYLVDLAKD